MADEEATLGPLGYVINTVKVRRMKHEEWFVGARVCLTPFFFVFRTLQLLIALSPLIALGYILLTAFEPPEVEAAKRKKKGFELEGHAE